MYIFCRPLLLSFDDLNDSLWCGVASTPRKQTHLSCGVQQLVFFLLLDVISSPVSLCATDDRSFGLD